MLRVYTASKLRQAVRWIALVREWPEVEFTARWVEQHTGLSESDPIVSRRFWLEDEEDVRRSDIVMVYAEGTEKQRGSLVEAGMGIAFRKLVLVVGDHPDYGTWQYHPQVMRVPSIGAARIWLQGYAKGLAVAA